MSLFLTILLGFSVFSTVAGATCRSDIRSCTVYSCLADELRCSSKNYLLRFGEHYCKQFLKPEVKKSFSKAGGLVVANIRLCLQNELVNDARLNCRTSKSLAQEHHLRCYVAAGFCELGFSDKYVILQQVYKELNDPDFALTTKDIGLACAERLL